ncbi:MAG: helix-turn-helix domain-containing protein [Candidatus Thiodiazotropha sp.]|jgi:transcriptional regulator GlxA family with amidase domain
MPKIALLVESGATPSSVTASLDLFGIADRFAMDDGIEIRLFSAKGGPVTLSAVLQVETSVLPERLEGFDAVILPGFFARDIGQLTEKLTSQWGPTIDRLLTLDRSTLAAASCYGTFVLAESGLLDGRSATTTWWLREDFERRYPRVSLLAERALVDDGMLLTAGAMTAHIDLSLHLLRRLMGHALARRVGSVMLVDEARSSQLPFMALPRRFDEPLIDAAIAWMEKRLATTFSAKELAGALHVSYRTLHRRFHAVTGMPPLSYLQALRVERAKEILEQTRKGVDQIAGEVGYCDSSSFRRLFTRLTSVTPAQYRRRFRGLER